MPKESSGICTTTFILTAAQPLTAQFCETVYIWCECCFPLKDFAMIQWIYSTDNKTLGRYKIIKCYREGKELTLHSGVTLR